MPQEYRFLYYDYYFYGGYNLYDVGQQYDYFQNIAAEYSPGPVFNNSGYTGSGSSSGSSSSAVVNQPISTTEQDQINTAGNQTGDGRPIITDQDMIDLLDVAGGGDEIFTGSGTGSADTIFDEAVPPADVGPPKPVMPDRRDFDSGMEWKWEYNEYLDAMKEWEANQQLPEDETPDVDPDTTSDITLEEPSTNVQNGEEFEEPLWDIDGNPLNQPARDIVAATAGITDAPDVITVGEADYDDGTGSEANDLVLTGDADYIPTDEELVDPYPTEAADDIVTVGVDDDPITGSDTTLDAPLDVQPVGDADYVPTGEDLVDPHPVVNDPVTVDPVTGQPTTDTPGVVDDTPITVQPGTTTPVVGAEDAPTTSLDGDPIHDAIVEQIGSPPRQADFPDQVSWQHALDLYLDNYHGLESELGGTPDPVTGTPPAEVVNTQPDPLDTVDDVIDNVLDDAIPDDLTTIDPEEYGGTPVDPETGESIEGDGDDDITPDDLLFDLGDIPNQIDPETGEEIEREEEDDGGGGFLAGLGSAFGDLIYDQSTGTWRWRNIATGIGLLAGLGSVDPPEYEGAAPLALPPGYNDPLPQLDFKREVTGLDDPSHYFTYGQENAPVNYEHRFFSGNLIPPTNPPPPDDVDSLPPPGTYDYDEYDIPLYARGGLALFGVGGPSGAPTERMRLFMGPGSGRSDDIPAQLSDGEYVMDSETVALLGDGSTSEGARRLDEMRSNLRKHKGEGLSKGEFSAAAKRPEQYMAKGGTPKASKVANFNMKGSALTRLKRLAAELQRALSGGINIRAKQLQGQMNAMTPGSYDVAKVEIARGGDVGRALTRLMFKGGRVVAEPTMHMSGPGRRLSDDEMEERVREHPDINPELLRQFRYERVKR